jgi:AGZA family xanthine/uracil permease-like MFS transporter
VAILPILLYIGLVIGAQAFQASPTRHAPAIVLALLPNIAAWGQNQVDTAIAVSGQALTPELVTRLSDTGAIVYHGMARFGGGAVLAGLMLGAIAVFIIDRDFRNAAIYSAAAAVLAFFGLIHGTQIGIGVNLDIVVGYLLMTAVTGYFAVRKPAEETEVAAVPAGAEAATP